MAVDVTVVVPVFNPGVNLAACLDALLAQTLGADRYEIVLVDDGSTDGTGAVLQQWERREPHRVRVISQPNSGWPGRPRNVGVDHARGDYVQFVDNDDVLAPRALERMLAAARDGDADVVLGKLSSDFRIVNHALYRADAQRVTWRDFPLVESLTPHKMFRTAFLREHGIRFAEGPRHLEDQLYCMHAYAHAQSVSVIGDEPCYFYRRRRGFGRNAGDVPADPDDYYRDLEDVFDVIDAHVGADDDLRGAVYERFFRVEMLGRLRDRVMLDYDDAYRNRLFDRVYDVATRRVPLAVDDRLPFLARRQARLLRAGDLGGLLAFATDLTSLAVDVVAVTPRWREGRIELDIDARLTWCGQPWRVDDAQALAEGSLDLDRSMVDVLVTSRADSVTWFIPPALQVRKRDDVLGVTATVAVDPRAVAGGHALSSGLWDLRLRVVIGGMTRTSTFATPDEGPRWCLYDDEPRTVATYRTAAGSLALDAGEWMHSLTDHVVTSASADSGSAWTVDRVVAPSTTSRAADLLLVGDDARRVTGRLEASQAGATLTASRRLPDDREVWLRLGAPGTAAPVRLIPPAD